MSAKDRAAIITKLYKFCKKNYDNHKPPSDRTILEHMIYACCLEDSSFEAADEALAKLQQQFFDWNEIRVTTTAELALMCKNCSEPMSAALRIKKSLHGLFEKWYTFEMDFLRKENLGKTMQILGGFPGVTPFVVSYTAQHGLGGHSIPVDESLLMLLYAVGAISEDDVEKGKVPGLERTIPKSNGIEFSNVVHHLASTYFGAPHKKETRATILKIASDAKDRFPKRGAKKRSELAAIKAAEEAAQKEADRIAAEEAAKAEKEQKAAEKKAATRKKAADKKAAAKAKAAKKKPVKKTAPPKKVAKKKPVKKKVAKKKASQKPAAKKKAKAKKKSIVKKAPKSKKSATGKLKRKKPR